MSFAYDPRFMAAAIALAQRGVGRTAHCPAVGAVLVRDGVVVGRGWTQAGGRPHAEAMALAQAGEKARGATLFVTLEPCAHVGRGPSCAETVITAGISQVVAACDDPDPRTAGQGFAALRAAGVDVVQGVMAEAARAPIVGYLSRQILGRPHITLKLALSLDGGIALDDGKALALTGEEARAHAHLMRARADVILVGRGTLVADDPQLTVRVAGLEAYSPRPAILTRDTSALPSSAKLMARNPLFLAAPEAVYELEGINSLMIEGGAQVARAFLAADLVDRLLLYRAPVILGAGRLAIADLGPEELAAQGGWQLFDTRRLGKDLLEVYDRNR